MIRITLEEDGEMLRCVVKGKHVAICESQKKDPCDCKGDMAMAMMILFLCEALKDRPVKRDLAQILRQGLSKLEAESKQ